MLTELIRHPFPPLYSPDSRKLILGTMPSPVSRKNQFYYGHPQNRFWKVLSIVFQAPFPENSKEKEKLILSQKLALWDVLSSCKISGASDSTINEPEANDFSKILNDSSITAVFCTGRKAFDLYNNLCRDRTGIDSVLLPSTSPANQRVSFDYLVNAYRVLAR
ncbi:MAG: DNA-deoxyinosine glycosylase [Spirochaetaceae bacterium]|jgi:hypoxanthine-DNA glycosylase|nr:DNA-deoxyinosine glycosylase [Spirochaetaceae bacterium]